MYIIAVIVKAENNVVKTITLLVRVPSDFIFFAIMYELGVVGEPSIITIAINFWSLNPSAIAMGRNITDHPTSFNAVAMTAGFTFSIAFPISKLPPIANSARGVVIFARLPIVLSQENLLSMRTKSHQLLFPK